MWREFDPKLYVVRTRRAHHVEFRGQRYMSATPLVRQSPGPISSEEGADLYVTQYEVPLVRQPPDHTLLRPSVPCIYTTREVLPRGQWERQCFEVPDPRRSARSFFLYTPHDGVQQCPSVQSHPVHWDP